MENPAGSRRPMRGGKAMKQRHPRKQWLMAAATLVLGIGVLRADEEPATVFVREPGRPQQRCAIEQTLPQPDGKTVYIVRDVATGERMRVVDNRQTKDGSGPVVGRLVAKLTAPADDGMTKALAGSPTPTPLRRVPTTAELAGDDSKTAVPQFKPVTPKLQPTAISPVAAKLQLLRQGETPIQRERAAMTLTLSDARTVPEVVQALTLAANDDKAASVRICCVRCLFRISADVPDVQAALVALTSDATFEVAETARLALREIERKKSQRRGDKMTKRP